jgi:hypothetical protein
MTIKDKAKKVTKEVIEEVVTPVDLVKDRVIELLKESKKTLTVILIIGFLVWLIT